MSHRIGPLIDPFNTHQPHRIGTQMVHINVHLPNTLLYPLGTK